MADLNFEGDLSGISDRQLEYVRSVLEKRGYKNEKVIVEAVGVAGDNYVANVKRITVEKDGNIFKMIAKVAPTVETLRQMMNTMLVFQNEHVMYTEVLPKLEELEIAADIPKEERLRYAQCYGSLSEPPNEVILLEDLQVSNFAMLDRLKSLTHECVMLVLKNFAVLHSLSYALKAQEPETFAAFKSKLFNMWVLIDQREDSTAFLEEYEKNAASILDDAYKKSFTGALTQIPRNATKMHKIDTQSKYSVIQQGDSWTNNIMFRSENGKSVECCMIDYQLSKESSPVADIQYMIFNCTNYETRSKHYNEWIDYYHSELDKSLANFGLKSNLIYPRDQLDADLRTYSKLSFGLSCMLATVLIRESADAAKFKEAMESADIEKMTNSTKMSTLNNDTIMRFRNRIEGLIDSYKDLGFM